MRKGKNLINNTNYKDIASINIFFQIYISLLMKLVCQLNL